MFYKKIFLIVFFITLIMFLNFNLSLAENLQLHNLVNSIEELTDIEKNELISMLESEFSSIFEKQNLDSTILLSVQNIIAAGIFEQAQFNIIANISYKVYISEQNKAPVKYVEDLALIGFSYPITQKQLEMAAKTIQHLVMNDVQPIVVEELISYSIYNGWNGDVIYSAGQGIITGKKNGIDSKKAALSIIIGIDQEIKNKSIDLIIEQSLDLAKKEEQHISEDKKLRDIAFNYLNKAILNGIPNQIANEMYTIAITDKWSTKVIIAVFDGLIKGQKVGLTNEKLATALIIRMSQGIDNTDPQILVNKEIEYIKQLEKKKLDVINSDNKKYKRKQKPIYSNQLSYIQPQKPSEKQVTPPITHYPTTSRNNLNEQLMWQTIKEYLGPPSTVYRWGGTSKYGIDCSGFVQAIYKAQGIYLPRTSKQQFRIGRIVRPEQLRFGDLIFFSKYFNNYITHVGIYLGNGKFVHSSSAKGVNITSINKRYYRSRCRGVRRIVY